MVYYIKDQIKNVYFCCIISIVLIISILRMNNVSQKEVDLSVDFKKKNDYDMFDEKDGYKIFLQDEWLFNMNITQYSSILIEEINGTITIESNVLLDNVISSSYINENVKCLIKIDAELIILKPVEIMDIHFMPIDPLGDPNELSYYRSFHRIRCILSNQYITTYKRARVSIIDIKYYEFYKNYFNNHKYLVSFQKPLFFNKSVPKIKGVANCVHMVNNIDDVRLKRFFDWIEIQRRIGYSKLKFFFFNVTRESRLKIKSFLQEYSKYDLIEIVDYKTSLEDLCYWSLNLLKNDPNSEFYLFLYNNCLKSYRKHFYDIRIENFGMYNSHERICSNDCLMKFKHVYEFVSNYDFDEIIFPRQIETTNEDLMYNLKVTNCDNFNLNLNLTSYNIYDFVSRLAKQYHFKNVACFHFEHVVFFDNQMILVDKLLDIYNNANSYKQGFIRYKIDYDYIDFSFKKLDTTFLNKFKNFNNIINCLNDTYMKTTNFDYKWNNVYACKMNMRRGKSIFNTDFTRSYYQHHSYNIEQNTRCIDVSINDGFVSHFRDNLDGFLLNQTYSFSVLKFDYEYYLFLLEISKTYKINIM